MTGSTCFTFRESDVKEKQSVSKSEKTKLFFFLSYLSVVCVCVSFRRCVSPRRNKCWRSVCRVCVKKTQSWGRVWPLYTHAWLCMTNSTNSTASRYYIQIHDILLLKTHTHTHRRDNRKQAQCGLVYEWKSLCNKGISLHAWGPGFRWDCGKHCKTITSSPSL